ncbi:MAG: MBL fold metallo-hydrolase [Deltaproteobacteria bacterium]|nr:MBL fold metallo-hydrolase [Deltaproteobacteria bacterium]
MKASIRFWGVRGSIPSCGAHTPRVGGNTSCTEIEIGGRRIILDGGTGLRAMGAACAGGHFSGCILFSHLHWDHIQGVPFFAPLYHPGSRIILMGPEGLRDALERQMSRPFFPVGMDAMRARIRFRTVKPGADFAFGPVRVRTCALHHPGGAIAYRLEHGDMSAVHALDHEFGDASCDGALIELARGADVLIADAQYLPEEYPSRRGWGHGTYEHCAALAESAGVARLVLAHHDPQRDDGDVFFAEQQARLLFAASQAAREGTQIALEPSRAESPCIQRVLESYLATALAAG